jgi:anti-sigma regulatory factor (Ser/Thr protein kinase)/serine/threonine protein phosphatase PrpC
VGIHARQILEIRHESDVAAARRSVRALAEALGFDPTASEDIALAVSELASNLVKHARGGTLELIPLAEGDRIGVQIEASDSGPGIPCVEEALRDGFSTAGSLGYGLGVVNRLMDRLDIDSAPGRGTRIVCHRWNRARPVNTKSCPLAIGAATRPHPRMAVNGDSFVIKHWEESVLVAVIDGLGHGPLAHRASQTARDYVETHFDQPLEEIFRGTDRTCRGTRGVVMALARFDWGKALLSFASIGNIEARVFGSPEPMNFTVRRGVIGGLAPRAAVTTHGWRPDYLFVLHSDGLSTHWRWDDVSEIAGAQAPALAAALLRKWGKADDDATVLVVRSELP